MKDNNLSGVWLYNAQTNCINKFSNGYLVEYLPVKSEHNWKDKEDVTGQFSKGWVELKEVAFPFKPAIKEKSENETEYELLLMLKNALKEADKLPFGKCIERQEEILQIVSIKRKSFNMSKEIKDYLHFYYGQKVVLFEGGLYYLTAKILVEWDERFQLAIRSISDMTEEELKESGLKTHPKFWMTESNIWCFTAEITRWLLSKHFDLFNLIPDLAIDAKILKLNT